MLERYTPEPFPPAFPPDFDPRADVYEVVDKDASGVLRVVSFQGQFWTVPPVMLAEGLNVNAQDRVIGRTDVSKKNGFLAKVLGRDSGGQPTLRIEPMQPDRQELEFAQQWLKALAKAGLKTEGIDFHSTLVDRLRGASFGSRSVPPLRKLLRSLLEDLVGRFPQRDDSWGADDAQALARELLAQLGVKGFEPSASKKRVKDRWHVLEPLAEDANRALQAHGSPLRLIACEREVFPLSPLGEDRDYLADLPVWLVLAPSAVPALEGADILRRYRGAAFPTAAVEPDPRVLRLRQQKTAQVVSITGAALATESTNVQGSPAPSPMATNPGPPKVPCRATVRTFVAMDGVGELVTEDGVAVRFGASACKDFQPQVGMEAWLIDFGPHRSGTGYKANVVNLSGKLEETRLAEAQDAGRLKAEHHQRELDLLQRHGLQTATWHYWTQLVTLPPESRRDLAADLVKLKRESHLFDRLFEELVTVDAEAFHPFLGELDWRAEPESLAWARAPYTNVKFAEAALAKSAAVHLREQVPLGTVAPASELARARSLTGQRRWSSRAGAGSLGLP